MSRSTVTLLNRPEKVNTNTISNTSRVLLGESENKTSRVSIGIGALLRGAVDVRAAFWLAEKRHILRQHKVLVVVERISSQELGQLAELRMSSRAAQIDHGRADVAHILRILRLLTLVL